MQERSAPQQNQTKLNRAVRCYPVTGMSSQVRKDIREFKESNKLDKVVLLWTANTERFSALEAGINDTKENILASIARGEEEVKQQRLSALPDPPSGFL